jgi:hypothetical protein
MNDTRIIDRKALVSRHNPVFINTKTGGPLSLGNGRFCFTADFTGLQSFPPPHAAFPLCTMSEWLWHRYPEAPRDQAGLRLEEYDAFGRTVRYAVDERGQEPLFKALRQNPHRANMGRLGLRLAGASYEDYTGLRQELSLWEGRLASRFLVKGRLVFVETLVRPDEDTVCVRVVSSLVRQGLAVFLRFAPAGHAASGEGAAGRGGVQVQTEPLEGGGLGLRCAMDEAHYAVQVRLGAGVRAVFGAADALSLSGTDETIECAVRFSPEPLGRAPEGFSEGRNACAAYWEAYWSRGGAIELAESQDPRAPELERRIVLSQYLAAIQSRGAYPPAETGLTCNSWYGKFHLEMHFWHSAHFALWGRVEELEKSLAFYKQILPVAQENAAGQGYAGARWPKMCDPSGYNSPSSIAVLLAWQQPHPIMLAELCYRAWPRRSFLEEYREVVLQSAEFMRSFVHWDGRRYVLGAPLIPAQERFDPRTVCNPAFELEYFRWALERADAWRTRLGEPPDPRFSETAAGLATPALGGGLYLAHELCPETFEDPRFRTDHPSMLAALGVLPGAGIDRAAMERTLKRVLRDWDRSSLWGWDFPMMAMCAARLGLRKEAVDLLLMHTPKNTYLCSGHNAQADRGDLPLYLPGNGGLLLAAAMMAGGWDNDGGTPAPGFPADGSFSVRSEGLARYV